MSRQQYKTVESVHLYLSGVSVSSQENKTVIYKDLKYKEPKYKVVGTGRDIHSFFSAAKLYKYSFSRRKRVSCCPWLCCSWSLSAIYFILKSSRGCHSSHPVNLCVRFCWIRRHNPMYLKVRPSLSLDQGQSPRPLPRASPLSRLSHRSLLGISKGVPLSPKVSGYRRSSG